VELARVITIALVVTAGLLLTPRFAAAGDDPADFIASSAIGGSQ